jgi:ribose/xylose/arabinose/galactoside ABC-type transport system permease subunit
MNGLRARLLGSLPLLALLLLVVGIGLARPSFVSLFSLQTMAMQTVFVALPALGMTFVVVAGGIDISIGSVVALTGVIAASLVRDGSAVGLAALVACVVGAAWGAANALLVTRLRVAPFLVTLGTMGIARGFAKRVAHDQKIDADPGFLGEFVRAVPGHEWMLFGPAVWLLLFALLLCLVLLRRTRFGLHVVAVGSNAEHARLCGVPVERTLVLAYAWCGLCAGAVGALQFGELSCGIPTAGTGLELQVVAAVVVGGASLSGGEGSLVGSVVGAALTVVLKAACTQLGVADHWQDVLVGSIIVVAVALDRWRHR